MANLAWIALLLITVPECNYPTLSDMVQPSLYHLYRTNCFRKMALAPGYAGIRVVRNADTNQIIATQTAIHVEISIEIQTHSTGLFRIFVK